MGATWPMGQKSWHAFAAEVGDAWVADAAVQERRIWIQPAAGSMHNFAEEPPPSPEEEEAWAAAAAPVESGMLW